MELRVTFAEIFGPRVPDNLRDNIRVPLHELRGSAEEKIEASELEPGDPLLHTLPDIPDERPEIHQDPVRETAAPDGIFSGLGKPTMKLKMEIPVVCILSNTHSLKVIDAVN
jgi:hypothetical protein